MGIRKHLTFWPTHPIAQRETRRISPSPLRLAIMLLLCLGLSAETLYSDVLVTKSGRRYEGAVTDMGDSYLLTISNGSKLTFPKAVTKMVIREKTGKAETRPSQGRGTDSGGAKTGRNEKHPGPGQSTVVSVASGIGLTEKSAVKEALRAAVEMAIGSVVSAETMIKNDKIISDSILTYSDGFVEKWEMVGEPRRTSDKLVRVTIKAVVRRTKLIERLRSENVAVTRVEGENLFAEAVSKFTKEKKGVALVRKLFDGFPGNVLAAEVVGKPRVIKTTEAGTAIGITVSFSVDPRKYTQWLAATGPLFQKLATQTKSIMWDPAKKGSKSLKELSEENLSPWGSMRTQFRIPPEKRKENTWGNVSIPLREWPRCYFIGKTSFIPDTGEIRHALVIAPRSGRSKASVFYLQEEIFRETTEIAFMSVPIVKVILRDSGGQSIDKEVQVPLFGESRGNLYYASPICYKEEGSDGLQTTAPWYEAEHSKTWKPTEKLPTRWRKPKIVFIAPYVHKGHSYSAALLTKFCNEFLFTIPTDSIAKLKTVEVKMSSVNNIPSE
jgi:hypothetical protein